MKKPFLLFLICFSFFRCAAQSFYVSGTSYSSNRIPAFRYEVHKVTITPNGAESELVKSCDNNAFYSIAANSKGFYWLDGKTLFRSDFDIPNNTISNCTPIAQALANSISLTVGKNNKAYYTIGTNLAVVDLITGQSTILGNMGYEAAGDLTFYNEDLYMASVSGLVKVDITDPGKSFIYMTTPGAYGLVTIPAGPRKNKVYSLVTNGGTRTDVIELDMENKREVGLVGYLPYTILDAASPYEDGSFLGIHIEKTNIRQDCDKPNAGIAEVVVTASNNSLTYKLSNGQTNNTGIFPGLAAGTYQVKVSLPGEEQTASFTVPAYSSTPPAYNYAIKKQDCDQPGEITFSTPSGASAYKIKLGNNTFPLDHVFANLQTNTYHFTIINDNACPVKEFDLLVPRDKCTIQFDKTLVAKECAAANKGSIAVLTNAHKDAYTYTLNGKTNATGIFNMLVPGSYNIKISSPEDSKTVTATIPDYSVNKPLITYTLTRPVCNAMGDIRFKTANFSQYKIRYDGKDFNFSGSITGLTAGTKRFTIIDFLGCVADEIDVNILQDECSPVVFPTAFTPNADGVNDIFRPDPSSKATNFTFKIFDRWGSQIFYSEGITNGWDGTVKGKPAPVSTYFWLASYLSQERKPLTQSGSFALIR